MTRLLVATRAGQGVRPGDFCWSAPGEPVVMATVCDVDRYAADPSVGGCGCARAFVGIASRRATTTAVVAELDWPEAEVLAAIGDAMAEWTTPRSARLAARRWLQLAARYDVGTLLGRRLDDLFPRGRAEVDGGSRW